MINRGKRSKTLKPFENISKNLQSFLEINLVQKEVLPSIKLRTMHEYKNPFELKEDITEKLPESIESSRFVSYRARENVRRV